MNKIIVLLLQLNNNNMEETKTDSLICWSLRCSDKTEEIIEQVENSNKVILPESMLYKYQDQDFPLHFTIKNT